MPRKPWFHRREQWDLHCFPWLCVHLKSKQSSTRIFCIWNGGLNIGKLYLRWGKHK
jgi:hypothetical protein